MIISLHLMFQQLTQLKMIMVAMFCLYMYSNFSLKQAIHCFDCEMEAFYKQNCYFWHLISCNESEIIPFKIHHKCPCCLV